MRFRHLLAKSVEDPKAPAAEATLVGHTELVVESAKAILAQVRGWVGMPAIRGVWQRVQYLVVFSAWLHDLGKATNMFQGMLRNEARFRGRPHPVRHEVLTALLLTQIDGAVRNWALEATAAFGETFPWMVSWICGGHHLALHKDSRPITADTDRLVRFDGVRGPFIFLGSHPDVRRILASAAAELNAAPSTTACADLTVALDEFEGVAGTQLQDLVDDYVAFSEGLAPQLADTDKEVLAFAKAVLIAADVAGSALPERGAAPSEWITRALAESWGEQDSESVLRETIKGSRLRPFQREVAESSSPLTVTVAGCGNGKTAAAYAWASKWAKGRKLVFCYPTTGTASAGFQDYLLAQTEIERVLVHGRAHVDVERMLTTADVDGLEEALQRDSLGAWGKQVAACTVDTVLGLMQNHRRPLFSFPVLARGAFVFDEVHSYDARMFGSLLRFLSAFPEVPVLLMSASIPARRIERLKRVARDRWNGVIGGDPDLEQLKRYHIKKADDPSECWAEVRRVLAECGKVLWACNRVPDAREVYEQAKENLQHWGLGVKPILYHSRFRYRDRVERQEAVLKAFRASGPALVVSTQVCEMSLNISADLLVTALAPFPSLVQRLGRLNRWSSPGPDGLGPPPKPCFYYPFTCERGRPYYPEDLESAEVILHDLTDRPCSQQDLAAALARVQEKEELKENSAWLDGIWQTDQRPLREGDSTITVVLEADLPAIRDELAVRDEHPSPSTLAPWTIPMLYQRGVDLSNRFGGLPAIPEHQIEYDDEKGARWRRKLWETW